jgi:hypothetical protein
MLLKSQAANCMVYLYYSTQALHDQLKMERNGFVNTIAMFQLIILMIKIIRNTGIPNR